MYNGGVRERVINEFWEHRETGKSKRRLRPKLGDIYIAIRPFEDPNEYGLVQVVGIFKNTFFKKKNEVYFVCLGNFSKPDTQALTLFDKHGFEVFGDVERAADFILLKKSRAKNTITVLKS